MNKLYCYYIMVSTLSKQTATNDKGGPFTGFSARQTVLNYKDNQQASTRKILRDVWNKAQSGYIYKNPNNVKYVHDSSLYTRYKKQQATIYNYNDLKNGGDESNASQVAFMAIRR